MFNAWNISLYSFNMHSKIRVHSNSLFLYVCPSGFFLYVFFVFHFLQFDLDMPRYRFWYLLFGVLWASWVCCLTSATNFGKILAIITSNITSAPLPLSSPVIPIMHMLHLWNCPSLWMFCPLFSFFLFFFSLNFKLRTVYWHIFKLTGYFLICVHSTDETIKDRLHLCYTISSFISSISCQFLFRIFYCLYYPYVYICCLFPLKPFTY